MLKRLSLSVLFVCAFVGLALAQDAEPTPVVVGADSLPAILTALVVASTPILVRFLASVAGALSAELPSYALPILAPLVGAVSTIALHFAGAGVPGVSTAWTALVGAVLGLAGTGLREAKDQLQRRVQNGPAS